MIGNSRSKASAMTCCSSRLASWLTRTVRGRRFVLRRGIGASVSGPMRIARPTRHQRCSREAVAIVRAQPTPWDRYRQIKRKFCTIVGGVVSPVLANLFLHYAFDLWMHAICHCASEAQALELRQALEQRFTARRLRLHPEKTKIVYCKDANRPGEYPERSFDFLGYTFRSRTAIGRDQKRFVSFIPAVADKAAKRIRL